MSNTNTRTGKTYTTTGAVRFFYVIGGRHSKWFRNAETRDKAFAAAVRSAEIATLANEPSLSTSSID